MEAGRNSVQWSSGLRQQGEGNTVWRVFFEELKSSYCFLIVLLFCGFLKDVKFCAFVFNA